MNSLFTPFKTYKAIINEYSESKKRGKSINNEKNIKTELFPFKPFENISVKIIFTNIKIYPIIRF